MEEQLKCVRGGGGGGGGGEEVGGEGIGGGERGIRLGAE